MGSRTALTIVGNNRVATRLSHTTAENWFSLVIIGRISPQTATTAIRAPALTAIGSGRNLPKLNPHRELTPTRFAVSHRPVMIADPTARVKFRLSSFTPVRHNRLGQLSICSGAWHWNDAPVIALDAGGTTGACCAGQHWTRPLLHSGNPSRRKRSIPNDGQPLPPTSTDSELSLFSLTDRI